MPDDRDEQDWLFQNHPDLADTRWTGKAAKRAAKQARKARRAQPAPMARTGSAIRDRTIVLVIIVVAGVVLVAKHPWSGPAISSVGQFTASTPQLTGTPQPTVITEQSKRIDLSQPFADTPAAGWSDGENGIRPPVAKAVGHFSAKQVGAATARVKKVLVAAHLDPELLFNHDTKSYLATLAPTARTGMAKKSKDPKESADLGGRLTLLAPGFTLLPVPVKVSGTMSVSIDKQGLLAVHTNYVFAFPFAPKDPSRIVASWQIVAVQHEQENFQVIADNHYRAADQGVFPQDSKGYVDAMACAPSKQGLLAPAYSETIPAGQQDNNDPDVYYDVHHSLDIGEC